MPTHPIETPACQAPPPTALDQAEVGIPCIVEQVSPAGHQPESSRWLAEIGFLPGERVTVLDRAWPAGDPLVVRVGGTSFALRNWEAACIRVRPLAPGSTS